MGRLCVVACLSHDPNPNHLINRPRVVRILGAVHLPLEPGWSGVIGLLDRTTGVNGQDYKGKVSTMVPLESGWSGVI